MPVDIVEGLPPRRLVARVKETGIGRRRHRGLLVANTHLRFLAKYVFGHHATIDGILKNVTKSLNDEPALSGA